MKSKSVKMCLALLPLISFIISCSENSEHLVTTDLKQVIEIKTGDLLIVNLGNFGDEEGATILSAPKNARESKLQRQDNSGAIYYHYSPLDHFFGRDSVKLILNKGSDGAGSGVNDTTNIRIIVN